MRHLSEKKFFIFVYLKDAVSAVPAAQANFTRDGNLIVRYGNRYVERSDAIAIDPLILPLDQKFGILSEGCLGTIRDAAPDYWGRLVISKILKQDIMSLHEVDFLLFKSSVRIGNLDFRASVDGGEPDIEPPFASDLENLLHAAKSIERGANVDKKYLLLLMQGTSLGGSRPKCTLIHKGFPYLAKFPSYRDTVSNARIEMATMLLAHECGISVPEMELLDVEGRDILLSRRFDRVKIKNGFTHKGYLSALSLCCCNEHDVYAYSYEDIVDKINIYCPESAIEFFRRMVFNIFCRNIDDHPRNHGFLFDGKNISLAPAFDITPTQSTPGVSTFPTQAMNVGAYGKEGTVENILSHAVKFGLTNSQSENIICEMIEKFSHWQQFFEQCGVKEEEMILYRNSFETRWTDVFDALLKKREEKSLPTP